MHAGRVAVVGNPPSCKAELGADATMDDVFAHYAGGGISEGGDFATPSRPARTAQRLG